MRLSACLALAFALAACDATSTSEQSKKPAGPSGPPEQIGQQGARAWASFECAAIASFAEDAKSLERHFKAGHTLGVEFVKAVQATPKDQQKRVTDKVPIIMLWRLQGPMPDFMLGRVWEATAEYVADELEDRDPQSHQPKEPSGEPIDTELRKAKAANHYRERNCQLLDT